MSSAFGSQQSQAPSNSFGSATGASQPQQGSLFGQQQQAPRTGSPFGGGGSLFQNPSQTVQSPAPASSPFGAVGGNASQPQQSSQTSTGSLFGAPASAAQTQNSQAGTSSLFGAPTQQQQAQASGNSLFGGGLGSTQTNPAQQQQQQQPSGLGGGLFGRVGTSQGQTEQQTSSASGGLFGRVGASQPQTQQAQQAGLGAPLFGGSTLGNQPATQASQVPAQNGTQTLNNLGSTQSAHFHTLIERGKKRQDPNGGAQFGDLPSLQLGLGDIASKVRRLGGTDASSKSRMDTLRDLNAFGTTSRQHVPQPPAAAETDIDAYVSNLRAKATAELFNESLEEAKRDFDNFIEDNIQINWEEQKRRIYEHFGLTKPTDRSDVNASPTARGSFAKSSQRGKGATSRGFGLDSFGSPGMNKSVLGGSVSKSTLRGSLFTDVASRATNNGFQSALENPWLRTKEEKYAAKVRELNSARLQEVVYPVIESFAAVELESGGDTPAHLIDAYRAIKEISKESAQGVRPSDAGVVRERQYAQDYLDDTPSSGRSTNIRKQVLDGSRKFLEESFFAQLEDLIAKNPREANLGGIPTKLNKVRAYVRLRAARKNLGPEVENLQMLGDDYCWALLYFLLRSGLVQEAAQYVSENERAIKSMDRHFAQYISAYARDPDRRLPRDMANQINMQYAQRSKIAPENSIDPFRMACYKIVGRCDLSRKNIEGIHVALEDWAWLVFSLAREVSRVEEPAAEVFGLQEARDIIIDIGQRHFVNNTESNSGYATFFLLQVLAGLFEQAVSWLYPHNYISAVHFAIALDYYGLLRVSNLDVAESELLTYTTRGKPQISFARLLGYYTRDFRLARPEAATDYLVLICLNADLPGSAGESQAEVCNEALKELVLETREFAQLLGDMQSDGKRVKGAIEQRLSLIKVGDAAEQATFLKNLTLQAAAVADDSGRTTDAVLLYHLGEEYDSVISIINRALSEAISVQIGQEPYHLQPLKPRSVQTDTQHAQRSNGDQQQQQARGTLSLTSVDDPADLARHMISLYNENALYFRKIQPVNREACGTLLRMSEIKGKVEAQQWGEALDMISRLELLPMNAQSNISVIRAAAQTFNTLPPAVARNIGPLLLWTIECCGRQRDVLRSSAFQVSREVVDGLAVAARDMMVFAGLIRYKLPPDVFEVLARAGQDIEGS